MTTSHDEGAREGTLDATLGASLDAVFKAAVASSIWASRPVDEEPAYVLIRWRLIALQGSLRLVGYNLTNREGRLSSRVVDIDVAAREVRTMSGRTYVLKGPPAWDNDGAWVLDRWLHREGVPAEEVRDFTPQLEATLSRPAP
jgi:hypothetical protein